ncbi:MAG: hypothetical protein A2Z14_06080 [Chloroflexi bacterium RBG_16_48_8]|nr:MAG: hypothetical protein A2Z14_06080 [Chloroflexi bacterium RBG_16_48_8]
MKHRMVYFVLILAVLVSACNLAGNNVPTQTVAPLVTSAIPCGDGVCSGPENAQNCPADCTVSAKSTDSVSSTTPEETLKPAPVLQGDAPLFMTTMTHMEGNWNDDQNEGIFLRHVEELRYGMDLAEEYGALLTIESEKPFARANTKWNLNIMAEIRDRGFGVGTHCDIGYKEPPISVEKFAAMFTENKSLVDALIGAENNLGCSGGGSVNDWALAASQAGFKYLDGIVSMHYLSMPIQNRPGSEWTDEFIRDEHFHLNSPTDLYQRIYPFEVANAQDFLPDENPVIVVSSGELGLFSAMAEKGREYGGGPILHDDEFTFDKTDVDALLEKIQEVNQNRDRTRIAKLCVYLPANAYVPENEEVLRYFFELMQTLQEQGIITWATQRQVYEAYVEWNK